MSNDLVRLRYNGGSPAVDDNLYRLTAQQRRFAEEYVIDLNGTAAAMRAGYSPKSAQATASRLMNTVSVSHYIDSLILERGERCEVTADMVVRELAGLALSNIINYDFDEDGFVTLREGAPDIALRAVKKIKRRVRYDENGDKIIETELELWDKNAAIRMLGKHLGMFIERHEHTGPGGGPIQTQQIWKFGDREITF
ncbi:MAG: terminase small subunit [Planctomycetota bacterium]|jgi:phage terminase small subunit